MQGQQQLHDAAAPPGFTRKVGGGSGFGVGGSGSSNSAVAGSHAGQASSDHQAVAARAAPPSGFSRGGWPGEQNPSSGFGEGFGAEPDRGGGLGRGRGRGAAVAAVAAHSTHGRGGAGPGGRGSSSTAVASTAPPGFFTKQGGQKAGGSSNAAAATAAISAGPGDRLGFSAAGGRGRGAPGFSGVVSDQHGELQAGRGLGMAASHVNTNNNVDSNEQQYPGRAVDMQRKTAANANLSKFTSAAFGRALKQIKGTASGVGGLAGDVDAVKKQQGPGQTVSQTPGQSQQDGEVAAQKRGQQQQQQQKGPATKGAAGKAVADGGKMTSSATAGDATARSREASELKSQKSGVGGKHGKDGVAAEGALQSKRSQQGVKHPSSPKKAWMAVAATSNATADADDVAGDGQLHKLDRKRSGRTRRRTADGSSTTTEGVGSTNDADVDDVSGSSKGARSRRPGAQPYAHPGQRPVGATASATAPRSDVLPEVQQLVDNIFTNVCGVKKAVAGAAASSCNSSSSSHESLVKSLVKHLASPKAAVDQLVLRPLASAVATDSGQSATASSESQDDHPAVASMVNGIFNKLKGVEEPLTNPVTQPVSHPQDPVKQLVSQAFARLLSEADDVSSSRAVAPAAAPAAAVSSTARQKTEIVEDGHTAPGSSESPIATTTGGSNTSSKASISAYKQAKDAAAAAATATPVIKLPGATAAQAAGGKPAGKSGVDIEEDVEASKPQRGTCKQQ